MRIGTVYSAKAGGKKHYFQVLLRKDVTEPGTPSLIAIFRKSYVEWDNPSLSEVLSGEILLITHMNMLGAKEFCKKEGVADPVMNPSRVFLRRGESIHVPNGPTVPISETPEGITPFPGEVLTRDTLLEIFKANAEGSLHAPGAPAPESGKPLAVGKNSQRGFLFFAGMMIVSAGITYFSALEPGGSALEGEALGILLCGLVVGSLYFYFRNHHRSILTIYPDHAEFFDQFDYVVRNYPYRWIRSVRKMKMVMGGGKSARIDDALFFTYEGEKDILPTKRIASRYYDFDFYRGIMAPVQGRNRYERNAILDTLAEAIEKYRNEKGLPME